MDNQQRRGVVQSLDARAHGASPDNCITGINISVTSASLFQVGSSDAETGQDGYTHFLLDPRDQRRPELYQCG